MPVRSLANFSHHFVYACVVRLFECFCACYSGVARWPNGFCASVFECCSTTRLVSGNKLSAVTKYSDLEKQASTMFTENLNLKFQTKFSFSPHLKCELHYSIRTQLFLLDIIFSKGRNLKLSDIQSFHSVLKFLFGCVNSPLDLRSKIKIEFPNCDLATHVLSTSCSTRRPRRGILKNLQS